MVIKMMGGIDRRTDGRQAVTLRLLLDAASVINRKCISSHNNQCRRGVSALLAP